VPRGRSSSGGSQMIALLSRTLQRVRGLVHTLHTPTLVPLRQAYAQGGPAHRQAVSVTVRLAVVALVRVQLVARRAVTRYTKMPVPSPGSVSE